MKKYFFIISLLFICSKNYSQNISIDSLDSYPILQEVVISANRIEEKKMNVSQEIQVITQEKIIQLQPQTTADLLANSGFVFVQKSQLGGGSINIRGFEANKNVLMIDGVRMNNLIYRAGHLQNIITTDNNIFDRVEILYGPASTIYGSDALGGVVHMYTRSPLFASGTKKSNICLNVSNRYSSVNNEFTSHIDVNAGFARIASLTSITVSSFGDLISGKNPNPFYNNNFGTRDYYVETFNGKDSIIKNESPSKQVPSAYRQIDFLQKFLFAQKPNIIHGLNLQYSNSSNVPRYDRLTDITPLGLKYAEWYYGPQTRFMGVYDLQLKNLFKGFQLIHLGVNYQNIYESRHTRKLNSPNLNNRYEHVSVVGINLDLHKKTDSHELNFGLEYYYNSLKSTADNFNRDNNLFTTLDTRFPDGENNMTNTSIYFSHLWRVGSHFSITDGARVGFSKLYSTFIDTSFFHLPFANARQNNSFVAGNIGLIHTFAKNGKISLVASTGYRVPNIDDLCKVFESAPGNVIVPNNTLSPEKTINFELGVTKYFSKKIRLISSIFYTILNEVIVTDRFKFDGKDSIVYEGVKSAIYANVNKQNAFITGLSSKIDYEFSKRTSADFSIKYTYGRIRTDSSTSPLDHIPPIMSSFNFYYTIKNFSSVCTINYNGWKRIQDYYLNGEDNEQYATTDGTPAWITFNLHFNYKLKKYVNIIAGVDNILDTQYRTFSSGINSPGRNFFITLALNN